MPSATARSKTRSKVSLQKSVELQVLSQGKIQFLYYNLYPLMLLYGAPVIPNDQMFEYASPQEWTRILMRFGEFFMLIFNIAMKDIGGSLNDDVETYRAYAYAAESFKLLLAKTSAKDLPGVMSRLFGGKKKLQGGGGKGEQSFYDMMFQTGGGDDSDSDSDDSDSESDEEEHVVVRNGKVVSSNSTGKRAVVLAASTGKGGQLVAKLGQATQQLAVYEEKKYAEVGMARANALAALNVNISTRIMTKGSNLHPETVTKSLRDMYSKIDDEIQVIKRGAVRYAAPGFKVENIDKEPLSPRAKKLLSSIKAALDKFHEKEYTEPAVTAQKKATSEFTKRVGLTVLGCVAVGGAYLLYNYGSDVLEEQRQQRAAAAAAAANDLAAQRLAANAAANAQAAASQGFLGGFGNALGVGFGAILGGVKDVAVGVAAGSGLKGAARTAGRAVGDAASGVATGLSDTVGDFFNTARLIATVVATGLGIGTIGLHGYGYRTASKEIEEIKTTLVDFMVRTRIEIINKLCDDYINEFHDLSEMIKHAYLLNPHNAGKLYSLLQAEGTEIRFTKAFNDKRLAQKTFQGIMDTLGPERQLEINAMFDKLITKANADLQKSLEKMKGYFNAPFEAMKIAQTRFREEGIPYSRSVASTILTSIGMSSQLTSMALAVAQRKRGVTPNLGVAPVLQLQDSTVARQAANSDARMKAEKKAAKAAKAAKAEADKAKAEAAAAKAEAAAAKAETEALRKAAKNAKNANSAAAAKAAEEAAKKAAAVTKAAEEAAAAAEAEAKAKAAAAAAAANAGNATPRVEGPPAGEGAFNAGGGGTRRVSRIRRKIHRRKTQRRQR